MKQSFFIKVCAALLAICLILTSTTAVQILKVYATEGEEQEEQQDWEEPAPEPDPAPTSDPVDTVPAPDPDPAPEPAPEPTPEPDYQPDPFDYNLICYTPSISFGTVYKGDVVQAKQFTIVNVGSTYFPLTWEEIDPYTAFDVGYISPSLDMNPGDSVTFSIAPVEGLQSGSYTASYTFFSANDIRRHHTAKVDVTLTVKDSTPYITGVEVVPGSVSLPAGKSYQFDALVSGGNGFDPSVAWSLAGSNNAGTKVDSNGKLTVAAGETASTFAVIATSRQDPSFAGRSIVTVTAVDYIVSVKADPAAGGAVAGGGAVRAGGSCSISASANNNYIFKGWYEGSTLVSGTGQTTINNIGSDRNLVAKFERKTCYIRTSVSDSNGGTVTGSTSVAYGGKVTIVAKANSGYSFGGFAENNKIISKAASLELNNVTSDRNITAIFNRDTCNVNVSVNPQDTGKYEGAGKYNRGSKVELRATAYDGYQFSGWTINGQVVSTDTTYVIKEIKSDVNVVANFMQKNANTYKMTSGIANAGGSIVPSGEYVVQEGGSATYNIAVQPGYRTASVLVDGKNVGAVASYTFNNIRGAHSIVASFDKVQTPAPSNSATPAAPSANKKADDQKKTDYTADTAADGAMPEQNVIDAQIPEAVEELEGEEYEEDVYIPATETTEEQSVYVGGIMAKHDLDETTLRMLINDDAVLPMLREAFEDGTLQITVNNSYAADTQETSVELYYSKPTLTNFEDVIAETLTQEEKYQVLTGNQVAFNIDITENTATIDEGTKKVMQTKVGYKPVSYFDFLIMKTSNGTTSVINNTAAELEVVVPIPEEFQKPGREFYVIRNHNGVVDVLEDIGDDPTTVTFRTDRFSEYAIAYKALDVNKLILRVIIIALISLVLALICFVNLVKYKRYARKHAGKRA